MPATDARLSATLAHSIKLDRNLSRIHDLSDTELEALNKDLVTHLMRWLNGKDRDLRPCSASVRSFCSAHGVPQLDAAWYLQLVREGVSDFLSHEDPADAGEIQERANRFFNGLVCDVLRS